MRPHSDSVVEQIRQVMQSSNPADIISGVKSAIADEVRALSPDAEIVSTSYFNHSYMPDLVLNWGDGRGRSERPIFLRTRLMSSQVAQDVAALATQDPVMVALTPPEPAQPLSNLREQARQTNRVLVTDVGSLAQIAAPVDSLQPVEVDAPPSPLLRLVQANLLKGGRGLLTGEDAAQLTRTATPDVERGIDQSFLASFQESTAELFAPDAALRLRRAAELLRFGASGDEIDAVTTDRGRLSDGELRVLLPFLLADANARRRSRLWAHVGGMMTLQQLEDMWDVLSDVDLGVLIAPNLTNWTAKRAQIVLNSEFESRSIEDSSATDDSSSGVPGDSSGVESRNSHDGASTAQTWHVRNRILVGEAGSLRLLVTTDARRLRGRQDGPAAQWDDISPLLSGFSLDSVDLLGVARRILVRAEESGDVARDVALIRANIEDSFYVREVVVRDLADAGLEDSIPMTVDFTEMTVTGDKVQLGSMVRAAAVLGYRESADFSHLLRVDAGGDPAAAE